MSALQQFIAGELDRRRWTVPDFARRAEISTSLAYQILDGKDNVRRTTFDKIAAAFGMTPAQLASAIGLGGALSPEHASVIAIYESVPKEKRSVWLDIGSAFHIASPRRSTTAKSPTYPTAKSRPQAEREMQDKRRKQANSSDDNPLTLRSHVGRAFAGLSRERVLVATAR